MSRLWGLLSRRISRLTGKSIGASGERVAERWLQRHGYRILDRNLAIAHDEADLLALDPDGSTLVIVEVKTRAGELHGSPEEAVGLVKQKRLTRLAARLQQSPRYRGKLIRFDVIAVLWPEGSNPQVRHIPAAFDSRL